tara:strand:- start:38 stop:448 length:411 start_codon:yes stop_codon:yes gene_type:complete
MNLIIDANIVIASLISTQGKTFEVMLSDKTKLFAPDYIEHEIEKYKEEILTKSELTDPEFHSLLTIVLSNINLAPYETFSKQINKAGEITPDPNDTEYFALALELNCPIWSNDKKLKEQDEVKIYSTDEILTFIND